MKVQTGNNYNKIIFGLALFIGLVSLGAKVKAETNSFGISPPAIRNTVLLRGSHFEQEIVLSRANPEKAAIAVIELDDPLLSKWITFEPGLEIELPKGEQRVTIKAIVDIPEDANLDIYTGIAQVVLQQFESDGQVILLPAVSLTIDLVVTDENVPDLRVLTVSANDVHAGDDVVFVIKSINTGNITTQFTKLEVEFLTISQEAYSSHSVTTFSNIEPFSEKTEEIVVPEKTLIAGNYFANVKVYGDDGIVYTDMVALNVLEAIIDESDPSGVQIGNVNLGYGMIAAGLGIIGLVFFFIYNTRKKENQE